MSEWLVIGGLSVFGGVVVLLSTMAVEKLGGLYGGIIGFVWARRCHWSNSLFSKAHCQVSLLVLQLASHLTKASPIFKRQCTLCLLEGILPVVTLPADDDTKSNLIWSNSCLVLSPLFIYYCGSIFLHPCPFSLAFTPNWPRWWWSPSAPGHFVV